jgi:hypothetical protein
MATYLLLRDNKESGPFSMNDLLNVGLKPYDLVWVQGKSAAWRYPSEVEELKPFAPVVEEQPFDRFYKKTTEEKKEEPVETKEWSEYAPATKREELGFVPGKSVFVTLPGQKTVAVERPVKTPPVMKASPVSPAITITESPEVIETKYSQPLDEIKEMYVKSLQQRKNKTARKSYLIAAIKKGSVIAGLICLGILAGLMIRSKPKSNTIAQQSVSTVPALMSSLSDEKPRHTIQDEKINVDNEPAGNTMDEEFTSSSGKDQSEKETTESPNITIRKESMIKPLEKKEFDKNKVGPNADFDILTGERTRKVRDDNSITEEVPPVEGKNKNSLHDLVSIASNDYKRVAFGGIRNLQLTVTNNSKYELDNVIVELQYLKPSEEPLRTENIRFRGVAPNGTSTIKIPDTNRGIKISYKIINIESKQSSDAVAGR